MKTIIYNYFVFRNDRFERPETYSEAANKMKRKENILLLNNNPTPI
ncbi:hypothetical protein [Flavobacterium sp.]